MLKGNMSYQYLIAQLGIDLNTKIGVFQVGKHDVISYGGWCCLLFELVSK